MAEETIIPFGARCWYWWGLSCNYWGTRTHSKALFQEAINSFGRAIKRAPVFAAAYYERGHIRGRELSQTEEAIADLSRAIELEPDWPEPYLQRGLIERFRFHPDAALRDLQKFINLGGDNGWREEAEYQIRSLLEERRTNQVISME
jgi:tetratricopeptide (TPR) repeat protein